jgi:hypothetical protein
MPFAEELAETAIRHSSLFSIGAFYGQADDLSPGAGLIFAAMPYPIFNHDVGRFEARSGPALVLTHECDIDQANDRQFNKNFVMAPLIPMSSFASMFDAGDRQRDLGRNLARDIAGDQISRMFFLPPPHGLLQVEGLGLGAFVYLNALASGHVSQFAAAGVRALCALSEYGMDAMDRKLRNHFLRPKAEQLARVR